MSAQEIFLYEFSTDLPGTSYEEGGYKKVREVYGELADAVRNRFGVNDETAVIITEYQFFGGMFEPETDDECDLVITCGDHRQGFSDIQPDLNFLHLIKWVKDGTLI
jgi:hypothetical protein